MVERTYRVGNMPFAIDNMLAGNISALPQRRSKPPTNLDVRSDKVAADFRKPFTKLAVFIYARPVELRVHRVRTCQHETPQTPAFPRRTQIRRQRLRVSHLRIDRHHRIKRLRHGANQYGRQQTDKKAFHQPTTLQHCSNPPV